MNNCQNCHQHSILETSSKAIRDLCKYCQQSTIRNLHYKSGKISLFPTCAYVYQRGARRGERCEDEPVNGEIYCRLCRGKKSIAMFV